MCIFCDMRMPIQMKWVMVKPAGTFFFFFFYLHTAPSYAETKNSLFSSHHSHLWSHSLWKSARRTCFSLSERETIVNVILFVVNWSRLILIYAIIVSSHAPDGQLRSRNGSRQVTGAPIRLRSSSTTETRCLLRDSAVIWEQDRVIIEELFSLKKKFKKNHCLTCSSYMQDPFTMLSVQLAPSQIKTFCRRDIQSILCKTEYNLAIIHRCTNTFITIYYLLSPQTSAIGSNCVPCVK